MPLGPLGVTAVLAALDWGAWEWATTANHPTLGLIAGLLMAPIAVAFAWSLARVLVALVQMGFKRGALKGSTGSDVTGLPVTGVPFDIEAHDERIAA